MYDLNEIKNLASHLPMLNQHDLIVELIRLKNGGVPFLGCLSFIHINQKVNLVQAKTILLALDVYSETEKFEIEQMNQIMLAEFNERN